MLILACNIVTDLRHLYLKKDVDQLESRGAK